MEMSLQFSVENNLLLGILIVGENKVYIVYHIQNVMLKAYFIRTLVSYFKKHIKSDAKVEENLSILCEIRTIMSKETTAMRYIFDAEDECIVFGDHN